MSAKHTRGPWAAGKQDSGRVVIQNAQWKPIATIAMRKSDEADCLANANLIAAAPELLEALKRIKQNIYEPDKVLLIAESAIARAEGGQS